MLGVVALSLFIRKYCQSFDCFLMLAGTVSSPVHKLLGNILATLGLFRNFQLVEQLSVHLATLELLCLDSHIMLLLRMKQ